MERPVYNLPDVPDGQFKNILQGKGDETAARKIFPEAMARLSNHTQ
jgi:hypothetical protein